MKKLTLIFATAFCAVMMSSCSMASFLSSGGAFVYEGTTSPLTVTSNPIGNHVKVGRSNSVMVLGLVGVGDGGINAAAKNGGISKISFVDVQKTSILGMFTKSETVVYGE